LSAGGQSIFLHIPCPQTCHWHMSYNAHSIANALLMLLSGTVNSYAGCATVCGYAGDGAKAVAKRKLQQAKLPFSKPDEQQAAEAQGEVSGSNEPEAASPAVLPKVTLASHLSSVLQGACSFHDV